MFNLPGRERKMDQKEKLLEEIGNTIRSVRDVLIYLTVFIYASFIVSVVSCTKAKAETVEPKHKIAIIDTGYNPELIKTGPKLKLCKSGHFDFVSGEDKIGYNTTFSKDHGTQIAAIIAKELQSVDYCAVIFTISSYYTAEQVISAFYKASNESVTVINASYNAIIKSVPEREAVKDAAKQVDAIFVSAGNNGLDLDKACLSFPACFDIPKMHVVGAKLGTDRPRAPTSNYGERVTKWESGKSLDGQSSGTSFAAPRALSRYIRSLEEPIITKKLSGN